MTTLVFPPGKSIIVAPIEKLIKNIDSISLHANRPLNLVSGVAVESIGISIVRALKSDVQWSHLCECWDTAFSEPVCPVCSSFNVDLPNGNDADCAKMISMLQSNPKIPSCIKSSNLLEQLNLITLSMNAWPPKTGGSISVLAAWIRRCLLRTRGEVSSDRSRCISVPLPSDKIIDVHFPLDFHCVRHIFDSKGTLMSSLVNCAILEPRGGKSNSKFVVTDDAQYIIKSLSPKEEEFLSENAPAFFWYYCKGVFQGMPTLLVPLLGMFTLRTLKGDDRHSFIVLHNLSPDSTSLLLDLKGAGSNRSIDGPGQSRHLYSPKCIVESDPASTKPFPDDIPSDELNLSGGQTPISPTSGKEVLWDEDFRKLLDTQKILLPAKNHQYLIDSISNDTEFLASMNVVDYSLFVAVQRDQNSEGTSMLYAGIIDFLRPYTWDKKLESVVKTVNANISNIGSRMSVITGGAEAAVRAMPVPEMDKAPTIIKPELYARRFRSNIGMLFSPCGDPDSIN